MPRRNKNRKSDDPVWASFKIPYEKWQHFKAVAKAEGNTASATLVDLIEDYLTSESIHHSQSESVAEAEVMTASEQNSLTEALKQTFQDLDHKIAASQAIFSNDDDHLSDILNQKITILEQSLTERLQETVRQRFASLDQKINQDLKRFLEKVDQLENKLNLLQQQVTHQNSDINPEQDYASDINYDPVLELIDIEVIAIENLAVQESKADLGLTQQELCQQFGIDSTKVTRNASLRNLSTPEYLDQVTGWVYREGKYYPPKL